MNTEENGFITKGLNLPDFSSPVLYQVKDSHYERESRALRQVQNKRAKFLKKLHGKDSLIKNETCTSYVKTNENEETWWIQTKSPDYSPPPQICFTPIQTGASFDVSRRIIKPTPRRVAVVRPVQYPDGENTGTLTQPLIRSAERTSPATSHRLPPKKRLYVSTPTDSKQTAKVPKMSIGSSETSAFYKFLPAHVMDDYFQELRHREEEEMTAEDKEVAEIMKHDTEEVDVFEISRESWENKMMEEMVFDDREVDRIVGAGQYLKPDICDSPKEAWMSNQTDGFSVSAGERSAYFRPISPEIRSFAESSTCDTTYQQESEVMPSNDYELSSLHAFDRFNTVSANGPQICIDSLRQVILKDSESHKRVIDVNKSQEEKFAELLEDFLAENELLPREIKDLILNMLTNVRTIVDEDNARQMTEIDGLTEYSLDSCYDEELTDGFERSADTDLFLDDTRKTPYYCYEDYLAC